MTVVRPYAAGDLEAVARTEALVFGAEAWDTSALEDLVAGPGRRLLVADQDGEPVGYVLTGMVGDFADLVRIGVAPTAQRRGHARALLEAAVEAAQRDGAERMLLEVSTGNAAARALYAHHGFVEIDRRPRYYRDGSSALVLQRDLTPLDNDRPGSGRMEP